MNRARGVLVLALLVSCSGGEERSSSDSLAARGKRVYMNICTACHNADPGQPGSVGPAIAGSSRELLEGMLVRGAYPPGYTPKRSTRAMPKYEQLAPHLDELAAFLAGPSPRPGS